MQVNFGTGKLWTVPSNSGSVTPRNFGAIQDVSLDISFVNKKLYGQNQFPLDVARGQGSISGKAAFGQIYADVVNQLFFGQTVAAGMTDVIQGEAGTIPGSTTYTVQCTNHTTFLYDLGVTITTAGVTIQATRVLSLTAVGQYTVDATTGTYTFYSGDASKTVAMSYVYAKAASGNKIAMTNQPLGTTPKFALMLYHVKDGNELTAYLPMCASTKLSLPMKVDDYVIQSLDFEAFDDGSGNVMTWSSTS